MLHRQGGLSVKRFSLSHNRFASMCRVVKLVKPPYVLSVLPVLTDESGAYKLRSG